MSLGIVTVCLQNCSQRDEEIILKRDQSYETSSAILRKDSANSDVQILLPNPKDPPVRDGDNWRITKKTNQ